MGQLICETAPTTPAAVAIITTVLLAGYAGETAHEVEAIAGATLPSHILASTPADVKRPAASEGAAA